MLTGNITGLRAIERKDLSQLLSWRNNPSFRRYFREYRELNSDQQAAWYEQFVLNDPSTRMFAVIDLGDMSLIGACGLCYIDWINRSADFSIYIGVSDIYIDEKYADDAASLLIKYGFEELNLHRLWAEVYQYDDRKTAFFRRLGFNLDGQHKDTCWSAGKWWDSLFFGLISPF
jgi:RimJ/RimL family protein N-acetyltransferase